MYLTTNPVSHEIFKDFESVRASSGQVAAPRAISNDSVTFAQSKITPKEDFNFPVFLAAAAGTFASLLLIRKYQGKSLHNDFIKLSKANNLKTNLKNAGKNILKFFSVEIDLKEVLALGAGSIIGGFTGGVITDKSNNTMPKVKEGIYQFFIMAVPASIVSGLLKLIEKTNIKNPSRKNLAKAGAIAVGLGSGMIIASKISNKFSNTFIDKNPKNARNIRVEDGLIHIDDIIMGLTLAKFPLVGKLGVDKILPLFYVLPGYETGKQK